VGVGVAGLLGTGVAWPSWQPQRRVFVRVSTSKDLRSQLRQERGRNIGFIGVASILGAILLPVFGLFYGGIILAAPLGYCAAFVIDNLNMGWLSLSIARPVLWLTNTFPWRFVSFIERSHDCEILRRAGGVYQFRHRALQDSLAPPSGVAPTPDEEDD